MLTRRLALWLWLGVTLVAAACTGNSSSVPCIADVQVELDIRTDAGGLDLVIDAVAWTLTGNGMPPMSGLIDTSAPGATASVEVFGLGPGKYTVELEARSEDGETSCRGASMFDVAVGAVTEVGVLLRCKGAPQYGAVRVNGAFNRCAELTKAVVAPLQTSVGNDITVSSRGEDFEGDPVEYAWTSTLGSFDDSSAPATVYTCEELGEPQLTISVSDDGFHDCVDSWTVDVSCVDGGGTGGTGGSGATGGQGGAGGHGGAGASDSSTGYNEIEFTGWFRFVGMPEILAAENRHLRVFIGRGE